MTFFRSYKNCGYPQSKFGGHLACERASETLSFVEEELIQLLDEVKKVELRKEMGQIDAEVADIQLDSLINAARTVEITGEGIVKVEAEKALNAAIKALMDALGVAV
jgi:hypothetical protein